MIKTTTTNKTHNYKARREMLEAEQDTSFLTFSLFASNERCHDQLKLNP
jgi:hypothetical protein